MEKLELINGAKIVNNIFKLNVNIRKILKWLNEIESIYQFLKYFSTL